MNRKEAILAMLDGKVVESYGDWFRFYGDGFQISNDHRKWRKDPAFYEGGYELVKQTKKVKLWQFVAVNGRITTEMYTDDLKYRWENGKLEAIEFPGTGHIKTNCFIEVEI